MKSLANDLLEVAKGVLKDYQSSYPIDRLDVCRDEKRLTQLVEKRGLGVFTLDLPALDAQLTMAFECGRLTIEGALSKKASSNVQVPRLFRGLWLRIFNDDGYLREVPDTTAIFLLRQLCCLGKKIEVECSLARRETVLKEYYDVELETQRPNLNWGADHLGSDDIIDRCDLIDLTSHNVRGDLFDEGNFRSDHRRENPQLRDLLRNCQRNFDNFSKALGEYRPAEFCESVQVYSKGIGLRHGPGAVADLSKKEYKYDFPYWPAKLSSIFDYGTFGAPRFGEPEGPVGAMPHLGIRPEISKTGRPEQICMDFNALLVHDTPVISEAGSKKIPELSEIKQGYQLNDSGHSVQNQRERPSNHEVPSKLIAVPKTAKGPRLIAAEPTAHQWCQQATRTFLETRLNTLFGDNFIAFRRQDLSQVLVQKASLDRSLATVDLSSASDRLSCWLVERAFRKNKTLLRALHASRTRWISDDISSESKNYLYLKKFAAQGTAVTFPIQTVIFFIIALTACGFKSNGPEDFLCNNRFCKPIARFRNRIRIFGDDIIIPSYGYDKLEMLLHAVGLKVNRSKSFVTGNFRESCGMDCFMGDNVTPVKTTSLASTGPQSRQSLISYSNNLFQKGLWHAAMVVESKLPRWVFSHLPVVGPGCGDIGRFSFCGSDISFLKKRYNTRYQREEIRSYAIKTRTPRIPTNVGSALLQYFAEAPQCDQKWKHGITGQPKTSDGLRWEFPYYA
nr:MAG: hypothetical protein 3 [Leviviridae sp.]